MQRSLCNVMVLGCEIYRPRQLCTQQVVHGFECRCQMLQRCIARIDHSCRQQIVIGMGGAGDLPRPQPVAIRLSHSESAEGQQIGFGLHNDGWHAQIAAQPHTLQAFPDKQRLARKPRHRCASGMYQIAVERLCNRVHGIDVGDQICRRLGLPHSKDVLRPQRSQQP